MSTSWTIDIETRRAADEAWRLLERKYIGGGALLDWLVTPYPWPPTLANEGFTAFPPLEVSLGLPDDFHALVDMQRRLAALPTIVTTIRSL